MQDVKINRNNFIGGSDLPIIMGISPFKSRFDLLLEKAGFKDNDFDGNQYTEYGNAIEPIIREFINERYKTTFLEDKLVREDLRGHCDGVDDTYLLEIKSTSKIKDNLENYESYLVQLLFYMDLYEKKKGILAVYRRPDNFEIVLNEKELYIYEIDIKDYKDKLKLIFDEIEKFRKDLIKVKENPFITELDLQPTEIIKLAEKINALEIELAKMKNLDNEIKKARAMMFNAMENHGIKKFETPNGTKITKVDSCDDKTEVVEEFDLEALKQYDERLYNDFLREKEVVKKGRKGYVKITFKKEEE